MIHDFFIQYGFHLLDVQRVPVVMASWFLCALAGIIFGPLAGRALPFIWLPFEIVFGRIGARLDKRDRAASDLFFRGFVLTMLCVIVAYAAGLYLQNFILRAPFHGINEILILSLFFVSGSLFYSLMQLYFSLRDKKQAKGAYFAIAQSARVNLAGADDYTITRIGMDISARLFDKAFVAPSFWFLLAGFPGVAIYSMLSFFAWRFGKDGFGKGFGKTALQLERLMGMIPHMLSGIFIALAGLFTPTGGMTRAVIGQIFGKSRAPYEEGGFPVSAMAFALNVNLGGAVTDIDGSAIKRSWIGPQGATARLEKGHLRRALYLTAMAQLLYVVSLAGVLFWSGKLF